MEMVLLNLKNLMKLWKNSSNKLMEYFIYEKYYIIIKNELISKINRINIIIIN